MISKYQLMLTIRLFEEALCPYIENGEIQTPCHLYIGQEAIAVGVCTQLENEDLVWGNHRSHGHYIAKGGDIDRLAGEIFCKETGCSGGRGGSMHIVDKQKGLMGTVPIVAATVPLSVGAALSMKLSGDASISVVFFGDGATEEGHVMESMNIAALYDLPVLFVLENNLYSSHMHVSQRRRETDLQKIGDMFGIPSVRVDGNDLELVSDVAKEIIDDLRQGNGPAILECMTYRWRGHVGSSWDDDVGVRRKDELTIWLQKDPISREKNRLLSQGFSEKEFNKINASIKKMIDATIKQALDAPYPKTQSIMKHVFAEN